MQTPAFYDQVRGLTVHDPLAEFLGAAGNGRIEYRYHDAAKLAGHSCPTVAAAYGMTLKALTHLYPDALPQGGGIRVEFRECWQARVRTLLLEHGDDPEVFVLRPVGQ